MVLGQVRLFIMGLTSCFSAVNRELQQSRTRYEYDRTSTADRVEGSLKKEILDSRCEIRNNFTLDLFETQRCAPARSLIVGKSFDSFICTGYVLLK